MKAILTKLWCYDCDLEDYSPEIPHNFWLQIILEINSDSNLGANEFSLYVCTPAALDGRLRYGSESVQWGRHLLVVRTYDYLIIRKIINDKIAECSAETWDELVVKLSRFFAWEYEDFVV